MKPLGLGEHGGLSIVREGRAFVAYLRYRDYSGRGRRIKRSGRRGLRRPGRYSRP